MQIRRRTPQGDGQEEAMMLVDESSRATPAVDLAIAAAAGPVVWQADGRDRTATQVAAVLAGVIALVGQAVTVLVVAHWDPAGVGGPVALTAAVCALLAMAAAGIQITFVARGRSPRRLPTSVWVIVRGATVVAFAVGWLSLNSGATILLIWPLGVYVGVELALTASFVGSMQAPGRAVRNVLVSPTHLGVLFGLLVVAVVLGNGARVVALELALALEMAIVAAVASYTAIRTVWEFEQRREEAVSEAERSRERRHRAHWLHDDVCADLRMVRMKVAADQLTMADVATELDELDHRMRSRQLDELLDGGTVTAVEVLQPYLRKAQSAGVALVEVPRYEHASVRIPSAPASSLRRAVAGLLSNAITAGATQVAIRLLPEADRITLTVEDDAGGFELAEVPAGRGLAMLAEDLGPENLEVRRGDRGAIVMVRVALPESPSSEAALR
jgi:signal transduction histidine kinase